MYQELTSLKDDILEVKDLMEELGYTEIEQRWTLHDIVLITRMISAEILKPHPDLDEIWELYDVTQMDVWELQWELDWEKRNVDIECPL